MTARQIARELAVIVFPQLPKDKEKLEKLELKTLIAKAVAMLSNYAKQNLAEANALLLKSEEKLMQAEAEHPDNADKIDELLPVPVTTGELKEQVDLVAHALDLVAEALDMPEIAVQLYSNDQNESSSQVMEFLNQLIMTYVNHKDEINQFLKEVAERWKMERMVTIDRDILRLACTEAFFMPDIPINVCISEAVELATRFADKRAAKFINGILADLAQPATVYRKTGVFALSVEIESKL